MELGGSFVWFLEAIGDGVTLRPWRNVRDNHLGKGKMYSKVVIRHLQCERTKERIDSLNEFVKQYYGVSGDNRASYELTVAKLLKKQSYKETKLEEGRSFFCSELVAKVYKHTKIMIETEAPSTMFLPVDFTS